MVNGEKLCAALLWIFYLTLDGITVINVFSCYNPLSAIQSNDQGGINIDGQLRNAGVSNGLE